MVTTRLLGDRGIRTIPERRGQLWTGAASTDILSNVQHGLTADITVGTDGADGGLPLLGL